MSETILVNTLTGVRELKKGALIWDNHIMEVKVPQPGTELRLMQVKVSQSGTIQINGSEGVSIRDNSD